MRKVKKVNDEKRVSVKKITKDLKEESTQEIILDEHILKVELSGKEYKIVCSSDYEEELAAGFKLTQVSLESASFTPFEKASEIFPEEVFALVHEFSKDLSAHKKTSASHSCILFSEGKLVFSVEDISRTSAVNKAIGYAALNGIQLEHCMLFSSGRVSEEIAKRVAAGGIKVLVSKSMPTVKAVDFCAWCNMRLIGKAWPDSFEVFV